MIKILRKIIDIILDCSGFTAHFTVSFGRSQIIWIYTLRDHKWKYDSGVSGGECRVCQWCEPGRAGSRG